MLLDVPWGLARVRLPIGPFTENLLEPLFNAGEADRNTFKGAIFLRSS